MKSLADDGGSQIEVVFSGPGLRHADQDQRRLRGAAETTVGQRREAVSMSERDEDEEREAKISSRSPEK